MLRRFSNKNKKNINLSKKIDCDDTSSIDFSTSEAEETAGFLRHGWVANKARQDFPLLVQPKYSVNDKPYLYLDSAATSQKPVSVIDSMNVYYQEYNSNVHRGAHCLSRKATSAYEEARQKVQNFIGAANPSEIIFTSGATDSINCIVQAFARYHLVADDDVILLTVAEHHSNMVPWQMLIEEKKHHNPDSRVQIMYIPLDMDTGCLDIKEMERILQTYGRRIKIVSFQHVSNVLGCINPLKEMVTMVHKHCDQAITLADACQSLPHTKINVIDLGIDFLVGSGHKMCGPTGIGILYGKLELLNSSKMRPYKGGGEMIDQVTLSSSTYQSSPSKYEAGTPPIAQAIGLGYAIDYLNKIGMDHIEAYVHELGTYMYQQLQYHVPSLTILGPKANQKRASLCAFYHPTVNSSDVATMLDTQSNIAIRVGHHCCQPLHNEIYHINSSSRASLYFYNTKEEIDIFVRELKETLGFISDMTPTASVNNNNDIIDI